MQAYTFRTKDTGDSRIDLSFLLDAPAGKDGYVTIRDGHFFKPNGERLRLWGVNVTDWSPGSVILSSKEDAPLYAAALARFGINCVRLHFLDLPSPRGIIDSGKDDSQHFDAEQLDRLDFWIAQLKSKGIYCDLNLVVGRSYKAGDGVEGYSRIGWAKALTYFDPRIIDLQKDYARQLLTHFNPYTGTEYRHEPSIMIVEMVNENSLIDTWLSGSLRPTHGTPPDLDAPVLPAYYADMLDAMYVEYQQTLAPEALARLKASAGIESASHLPRLNPDEIASASTEQFQAEVAFYMGIERSYFRNMKSFLKDELGVQSLLIGSNDHMYSQSGYPMMWSNSELDIMDGHMYWQHPAHASGANTPMVNEPLRSVPVRLSRTGIAGKPYMVSEVNHIFPGDWISEGIPILAAYASLQDWDGLIWYTFEPKKDPDLQSYVGDAFDLSLDPVRMPQLAAAALMFQRGDVSAARTTIERTYAMEQVRESLRLPVKELPYYTPGFPISLALQHKMRVGSLDGPATAPVSAEASNPIISDTGELAWYLSPDGKGLVAVDTPRSQALIGFVREYSVSAANLSADIANAFCAITLSSLGIEPIAQASRLLLTLGAGVENSGQRWNEARTEVVEFGGPPSLVEAVTGRIMLKNLDTATGVAAYPLDGSGRPIGEPIAAQKTPDGWAIDVGSTVTTWYEIVVSR